ncbi:MAG: DNA polymerase III subunit delta [candidate division Zixibacteria bacterium]
MDSDSLKKEIGAGKYRPVYYFYGEEDYRKVEAYKYLLNNYIPGRQKLLNSNKFSADKIDLETIICELSAIPMLGERRLIFIENIQKLKPTQYKWLFNFLTAPPPETVVILSTPGSYTPDKRGAFFKAITKIAEPMQFTRLKAGSAKVRIIRHLESLGFTFDAEAVDLLVSLTDGDFGGLAGELDKLAISNESGSHIGINEIKSLSSSHEEFGIFELIDMIAEKDSNRALFAYNDMVKKGSNPTGLLFLLSRHLMSLLKIHAGKKLARHPFFISKLKKQAALYDKNATLNAISKIAITERKVRKSGLEPVLLVENLIREISR